MEINKKSAFYIKATRMLQEYVALGGDVNDLGLKSDVYKYIKDAKVFDENGKYVSVEQKFSLLGFPRNARRTSDMRRDLINEIEEYLTSGGSFHVRRKTLPFYERLHAYSIQLKNKGVKMTHEQIMREDLGYRQYSDLYFRSLALKGLAQYRDKNGYIDSYRENRKLRLYVTDLSQTLGVPYYITISLIADEKLSEYDVCLDKIEYTRQLLQNYADENGSLIGITSSNQKIYDAFCYLISNFSDGTQEKFSKEEWLSIFGLSDYMHKFKGSQNKREIDISDIMQKLKLKYGNAQVFIKDIDSGDYSRIVKKAVSLGSSVEDVFKMYGINYKGTTRARLSTVTLKYIPYFEEMRALRDALISGYGISELVGNTKEEVFEAKVKAVQTVYVEFKERLENYTPNEKMLSEEKIETII